MGRHSAPSKVKPRALLTGALVSSAALVTGSFFITPPQSKQGEWSPVESSTPLGLPTVYPKPTIPENASGEEAVANALVSVQTVADTSQRKPTSSPTPQRPVQRELRSPVPSPSPRVRPSPIPRTVESPRIVQVRADSGSEPISQPKVYAKASTKRTTAKESSSANRIASNARVLANMDIQYVFGGKSVRSGLDCSSFVWEALKRSGYKVPYRNSRALKSWTTPISKANARAGDLVFWPGHVGVYLGNGMVADAGSPKTDTSIRKVWGSPTYGRIPSK